VNVRHVASVQAAFYVGTGVWPLMHRRSFEWMTGPKTDFWLAQTVGLTVAASEVYRPSYAPLPLRVPPGSHLSISRLSLEAASPRSISPTQPPKSRS
jgi:hypothetical protein